MYINVLFFFNYLLEDKIRVSSWNLGLIFLVRCRVSKVYHLRLLDRYSLQHGGFWYSNQQTFWRQNTETLFYSFIIIIIENYDTRWYFSTFRFGERLILVILPQESMLLFTEVCFVKYTGLRLHIHLLLLSSLQFKVPNCLILLIKD